MQMKNILYILISSLIVFASCNTQCDESPIADFTHSGGFIFSDSTGNRHYTPTVFTNISHNACQYSWTFGDGSTSAVSDPTHIYVNPGEFVVTLTATNSCGSHVATDTVCVGWLSVDKPNIYIYPKNTINLKLALEFPQDGRVVKSIPEIQNNQWDVSVEPTGIIDGSYDFLFYESLQPDVWQTQKGWCVPVDSLTSFFVSNLTAYNFSDKEIADFIEFWIPILKDYSYYKIYPQTNATIEQVIRLKLSSQPDNLRRLFYRVIGCNEYTAIPPAEIEDVPREGYYIFEWGVIWK